MDIAIKFEKINLGEDKFLFKPVSVIQGVYDAEIDTFRTEYGESCAPYDGDSQYEDNYFGALTTIDELKEIYGDMIEEELLNEYFYECNSYYCLGYYDYVVGKIRVLNIPYDDLENYFSSPKKSYKLTDNNIKNSFDVEKLRELRNIKDLKELRSKLDEIIKCADMIKEENGKTIREQIFRKPSESQQENKVLSLKKEDSNKMTLKELREEIKSVIKGQDKAVDVVTRALVVNQTSKNPKHKSHMLIFGPSGTGKTEMINIASKKMGVPYFKADATAYTKEGYVGKSVYSMFNGLIEAANGDLEKAQNGILIIDEIDKKLSSRKDDVGGIDVLNSLLKIMDRDIIELEQSTPTGKGQLLFDTSNLTIIFMGAFAELYKEKEAPKKNLIGFGNTLSGESKENKVSISNEDLIKAGMPPEFLGRIPVVTNTEELSIENLVEILHKSKGGVIDEEKEYFKGHGITIKFTNPYMREIAQRAYNSKTGARNLRKLVRETLCDVYDDFLSGKDMKVLKITKKTAFDSKNYCAY